MIRVSDQQPSCRPADGVPAAARTGEGAFADVVSANRRRRRFWRVVGPLMSLVWLVFLSEPLTSIETGSPLVRVLTVLGVLGVAGVFAASFLVLGAVSRRPRSLRLTTVVAVVALQIGFVVLATLGAHEHGLVGLVFVSVTFLYLSQSAVGLVGTLVCAVAAFVIPRVVPGWEAEDGTVVAIALASLAVYGFVQLVQRNRQLVAAQEEVAALAVSRERERIARDMHDLLGHSLTVVAVKSELASRLVTRDPERAAAELRDIQSLARSALADVRGTVAAIHQPTLAGELAAAARALEAAGVEVRTPSTVDMVPEDLRALFAWAVREGTTNVLRHAGAARVVVTLAPDRVVVEDDGRGAGAGAAQGSPGGAPGRGLEGLAERARSLGAVLETGPGASGGFRLAVRRVAGRADRAGRSPGTDPGTGHVAAPAPQVAAPGEAR